VILAMFFPCVATFMVILKELGVKKLIQGTIIMLFASILTGLILNLVL
jgi:ferrous iron transport protein B